MRFVANLRPETIDAFAAQEMQPAAYLLSAHRVSPASLASAARIRRLNLPLFADNGTKPLIEDTIAAFEERAGEIRLALKSLRRQLGRVPRGRDVPDELRAKASKLAADVVQHATQLSDAIDPAALIATQLTMRPTDLVAQEDFATVCLLGLGLERETTGWSVSDFDRRNRRSLRLWRRVAGDPRCADLRVYAVLSAVDYNTARSAGQLAAAARSDARGNRDCGDDLRCERDGFHGVRENDRHAGETCAPALRPFGQVLRGMADGYVNAGKTMERFHCLGLGAPSMFPIAAARNGRNDTDD